MPGAFTTFQVIFWRRRSCLATPLDHFQRFAKKQEIEAQFSEDIRHVIQGGYGSGTSSRGDGVGCVGRRGVRAHSPGLAAGAALALGATRHPGPEQPLACGSAPERAWGVQRKEQSRCPFDDHSAFMRSSASGLGSGGGEDALTLKPPTPTQQQQREAYEASKTVGKKNRDLQTRVFAAAPFDTPESALPSSTYRSSSEAAAASHGAPGISASGGAVLDQMQTYSDSRREAASNRSRMTGTDGLLAGNYLLGEGRTAVPIGRSSKPPQREKLLPQAMFKAQMDGLGRPSDDRTAYLNAKVLSEACRDRNQGSLLQFG